MTASSHPPTSSPQHSITPISETYMDLPTSPVPIPSAEPPLTPDPWRWRCHSCLRVYRIATTQRCLSCGHRLCSSNATPVRSSRSRRRKKRDKQICRTEFDYEGWEQFGEWRRDSNEHDENPHRWQRTMTICLRHAHKALAKSGNAESRGQRLEIAEAKRRKVRAKARMRRLEDRTHDCTKDCDYPSNCTRVHLEALWHAVSDDETVGAEVREVGGAEKLAESPKSPPPEELDLENYLLCLEKSSSS